MTSMERILAIDPSLRSAGYAVLECEARRIRATDYGIIKNAAGLRQSACLLQIHNRVASLITAHNPHALAMESIIYVQSYKTAIILGAARAAAILAATEAELPVYEYAPRRVKQAVVGRGGAQKHQVAFMVRVELRLSETPPADAADALAIGLTHFQTSPLRQSHDGIRI